MMVFETILGMEALISDKFRVLASCRFIENRSILYCEAAIVLEGRHKVCQTIREFNA